MNEWNLVSEKKRMGIAEKEASTDKDTDVGQSMSSMRVCHAY